MSRYDPAGDLAPRDRVARAILLERARTGGRVFLTMQHLPPADVHARFPWIAELCRAAGLDLATDRIPVGPAAHYLMGGVTTDLDGRTSLPGLFAAGEVACTGVHGANRLASNSLLEGLVFGARAADAMAQWNGRDWPRSGQPIAPAAPSSALHADRADRQPRRASADVEIGRRVSRSRGARRRARSARAGVACDSRGISRRVRRSIAKPGRG